MAAFVGALSGTPLRTAAAARAPAAVSVRPRRVGPLPARRAARAALRMAADAGGDASSGDAGSDAGAGAGATATAPPPPAAAEGETFQFQAEVSRVMKLIINSLYSNKEIFARELVSNASDACDKKRFLSLTDGGAASETDFFIRVKADGDAKTITIEDNGIGMTKQELIANLGSIATSGTAKFAEALGESAKTDDVTLIGQFGVGFYAAFLVADHVTVVSRSATAASAPTYTWTSDSESSYTITEGDGGMPLEGDSGTRITLHVKSGSMELLENHRLGDLLRRYSEFIAFPIYAWETSTEMVDEPDGEEKNEDGTQKMKKVPTTVSEWAQVNKLKPLWMRRPREVEEEDYNEFYKTLAKDPLAPMAHSHFAVEGDVEFRAVLFTPSMLPYELQQNMFDEAGRMLKLYVKRVFISDKFEEFVPRWLCFVRGVVDSEDLPLNVSREILQQSRVLRIISKRLVRKCVDMFKEIAGREDSTDYTKFWSQFGRYLKAGIIDDSDYAEELAGLTRWYSSASGEDVTSFAEYVGRMKEGQSEIYYVTGSSKAAAASAPAMEKLRSAGYEVLYLTEAIDEISIQSLSTIKMKLAVDSDAGKAGEEGTLKLVDVAKESFKMPSEADKSDQDKAKDEAAAAELTDVTAYLQTLLTKTVAKVTLSERLTESPSAIVQSDFGVSPTMERYMRENSATGSSDMEQYLSTARTLEINPDHPIVLSLKAKLSADKDGDASTQQLGTLLYDLALLTGGYNLADTAGFASRVSKLVSVAVGAPPPAAAAAPKEDPPAAASESKAVDPEVV